MTTLKVDKLAIRRFLLERQGLLPSVKKTVKRRPSLDTIEKVIKQLECVQLDPVSVVERNQNLVLAARIPGFQPDQLDTLLSEGRLFEYWANAACTLPIEDYPLFKTIRERRFNRVKAELDAMKEVVKRIMDQLEKEGPLPSRVFKSEAKVHGYWDNQAPKTKETSHALNLLVDADLIRVVKRSGTERFFGITEQTLPKDLLEKAHSIDTDKAREALIDKYIRAYRVVDPRDSRFGWDVMPAAKRQAEVQHRVQKGLLIPLEIFGVKRPYFILSEDAERLVELSNTSSSRSPIGPITLLPPLDNLLWSRERVQDLFDFDYKWEIYTPQVKRRFGPYAMPILYGNQLIGRVDPLLDRKEGKLIIRFLHLEPSIKVTSALKNKLSQALVAFAQFHGVQDVEIQRLEPQDSL
ncbi:crosslink repair DNA glycosylase YcaQ family protein [Pullulanibacillus sp. KACC 23026]|uniref:winged helix-turn-helix domain-containing protein n=1 Tax=Pullulanibacillus sp. KACC 23026 TaxID=3028315 RepID=UPI0023B1250D|nr:crosslink repair DNA glycosylase YcaQ family protein [Pullulanibacillus sp. KACC 23026]WEG12938.1 crosslink repair DNA glycosylase YcaQ family protein [Pullulanibacillus sp. KACC 23026]